MTKYVKIGIPHKLIFPGKIIQSNTTEDKKHEMLITLHKKILEYYQTQL